MLHIKSRKALYLFLIVWLHISILDLFFVNYSGPVFLWQENSEPLTLLVHFLIAAFTTLSFLLAEKMHQQYDEGAFSIREPLLITASCIMAISIAVLTLS